MMMKHSKVLLIAAALVMMVSVGALASQAQERVNTSTETRMADTGECTGEELQLRVRVQRQLEQRLGENGAQTLAQVRRFGRR